MATRKAAGLSDADARGAKPREKQYNLYDTGGLYLTVALTGAKWWRLKYRYGGREKRIGLGAYPEVTLKEARHRRDDARLALRDGNDPGEQRKTKRDEAARAQRGHFGTVAAEWLEHKRAGWAAETARKADYVLKGYLLPKLRGLSVATLTSRDVAAVLRGMQDKPDIARKARQFAKGIIRYAIREGLRDDGRVLDLDETLPPADKDHIPAATMPEDIRKLMLAIRDYSVEVTRAALLTCAYTAQRPGNVATMRWDELELTTAEWRIPAAKMKKRHAHIVPLPKQVLRLLDEMKKYSAGREYVFPPLARQKTPHLHRDALSNALRRMGFAGKHATHGFRGMFRTVGRERLNIDSDVLEAQLAHAKKGDVAKAYDRTTFGDARRKAMQKWANYLEGLSAIKVEPIYQLRVAKTQS